LFVFNNAQFERTARNFKEPATDKTETDQALVPEAVGEKGGTLSPGIFNWHQSGPLRKIKNSIPLLKINT
jgi:hypothetical protein